MIKKCTPAILVILILAGLIPSLRAETSGQQTPADAERRIADLEQQLLDLKAEVAALKAAPGNSAKLVPAVAVQSNATVPSAAAAPTTPSKPGPLDGIASVLNGATVTGLVDGYYQYNFNNPSTATTLISNTPGNYAAFRFFDPRDNQLSLNLMEFGLVKTPDADNRMGYKIIFGYGDAMQAINLSGGDPAYLQYMKEVYGSVLLPVGKGLQVDFGKFVTPMGSEVIESNANWNYSRSLLFNYAIPLYHFGARAQYTFNPKVALTGFVVNGWNDVIHDNSTGYNNSGKTGGLSLAYTATKKLTLTQTWLGGPGATQLDGNNWRNVFDTVIAYNATPKLSLMANGDYGTVAGCNQYNSACLQYNKSKNWWGGAAYAKYQFNPKYAAAVRYEYYNDPNGYTTGVVDQNGVGPHIQEVTATFERKIATHIISRLEYRHDSTNQDFVPKGKPGTPPVGYQNTLQVGLMFVLEPPPAAAAADSK